MLRKQLQVGFLPSVSLDKAAPTFSTTAPLPRLDINQGFECRR